MTAQEFEYFGRSEARMNKVYGRHMHGVVKLRDAIRTNHKCLYHPGEEMTEEGSENKGGKENGEDDNEDDNNGQGEA